MGYAPITRVATAPSPAASGTSLTVTTDTGVLMPPIPFLALVWPEGEIPQVGANAEYVQVTAVSGDEMTVARSASPVEIEAGYMFASVVRVPNYERGTPITLTAHFGEDDPPYQVHVCDPVGGTAIYAAEENDGSGNVTKTLTPTKSGTWAYRWEGGSGMLEDQEFFVNYSPAL